MSLTDEEQHLFNYMKLVSVSPCEETENVYQEIISYAENNNTKQLGEALSSINSVIKDFDLEIAEAVDENSMKTVHCLISINNNNPAAERAIFYDKPTCELLSKVIQECVTSDHGWVSEIKCLNASTSMRANKSNLQSSLERLIKDKWLVSENGKVSLGVRCQLEFEIAIKKQYPNYVKCCALCCTFMIQGNTCSQCESHTHNHCMKKYYEMNKLSATCGICPICKERDNDKTTDESMNCDEEVVAFNPPAKKMRRTQGSDLT